MYKDTKNFVRFCTVCLSRKNAFKIPPAPHQPVEQSQEPGETCHIDIFGPLKTTPKGTRTFPLIADGLQTSSVLSGSEGAFPLIADGLQTSGVLPSSTGAFPLIADGLQTFEVLSRRGAPNILCSVDASAISSGRHTHMIAELSSCDGTIFLFYCWL
ncbi:integrase_H2C2 domain-containing protein [Trichonephila clavipes]|nr:integrase_H2C2 domain-containing protein [Trichonephila clavipes]